MRRTGPASAGARALLLVLLAAAPAQSAPTLEVAGSVVATAPRLRVSVVVTNRRFGEVPSIQVAGELLGQRREAVIPSLAAGASGTVTLEFDAAEARPGEHALVLLLEYPIAGAADAAGNPPLASERAWLPIVLGTKTTPAVRLEPKAEPLAVFGRLEVVMGSADGAAHRVRLRVFTPHGLRADGDGLEVEVPAQGEVSAALPLVRAGAPRGSSHAVILVAETVDGSLVQSSVAQQTVQVAPYPSLLPRLRLPILVLACLLLGAAAGVEVWFRVRHPSGGVRSGDS